MPDSKQSVKRVGQFSILLMRQLGWYSKFAVGYVFLSNVVKNDALPPNISQWFTDWILNPPLWLSAIFAVFFLFVWPVIDLKVILVGERLYLFSKDPNLSEMKSMLKERQ